MRAESDVVVLRGAGVRFGEAAALTRLDLLLGAGEVLGLVGPNGAGKSTTIGVITGLVALSSGTATVLGGAPVAARAQMGVLPEQNGFYIWMDAPEYLAFFAALRGVPNDGAALLRCVGLASPRGMRQRPGLARALIGGPRLLILDELTNGLDPRGRRALHDPLRDEARRCGCAVLLCTHLLDDVDRLCDRVAILMNGRLLADGPPRWRCSAPLELVAAASNPAAPRMGDRLAFHSSLTLPVAGRALLWLDFVRVDPGQEALMSLEDWSAEKALVVEAVPGQPIPAAWTMRLIQAGTYRMMVNALTADGGGVITSAPLTVTVAPKPVVESGRVLPVALGLPLLLGGLLLWRAARQRRRRS